MDLRRTFCGLFEDVRECVRRNINLFAKHLILNNTKLKTLNRKYRISRIALILKYGIYGKYAHTHYHPVTTPKG